MTDETRDRIFRDLIDDYTACNSAKETHRGLIDNYIRWYNADDIPDFEGRSRVKLRWIKAAVDSAINRLVNDITKDYEIVRAMPKEYTPFENSVAMTHALNEIWNMQENNKRGFAELLCSYFMGQGTVIVKDSFEYDFDIVVEDVPVPKVREDVDEYGQPVMIDVDIDAIRQELLAQKMKILKEKETLTDIIFTVEYKKITKQYPSFRVVDNKNFMYDTNATSLEEARYLIEMFKMSISAIRKLDKKRNPEHGLFENTEALIEELVKTNKVDATNITTAGDNTSGDYHRYIDDIANKNARMEVDVMRYIGQYDSGTLRNGKPSGMTVKIEAYFTEDVLLSIKEYDLPVECQYHMSRQKTHINEQWGEPSIVVQGHAYQMGGSACLRTLIDTAADHALGREYIWRNTVQSPTEAEKIRRRVAGIVWTDTDPNVGIKSKESIPIQSAIIQLMQMLSYQFQKETASPDNALGVSGGMQADSATEAQIAQNGFLVTYMSYFNALRDDIFRPMFNNFALYLDAYIPENSEFFVTHMYGTKATAKFDGALLKGKFDNDIIMSSRSIVNEDTNRLLALMQTLPQLMQLNAMPPSFPAQLYARIFDRYGDKELTQSLNDYQAMLKSQEFQMAVNQAATQMATQMLNSTEVQQGLKKDKDVMNENENLRREAQEAKKMKGKEE